MELPPAEAAAPLFHQALKKLDWAVVDLQNRHEYWHDGRFVAQEVYDDPVLQDGEWIDEATTNIPLGGKQHPAEPLTILIAVYVLAGLPLKPLVEKLHMTLWIAEDYKPLPPGPYIGQLVAYVRAKAHKHTG